MGFPFLRVVEDARPPGSCGLLAGTPFDTAGAAAVGFHESDLMLLVGVRPDPCPGFQQRRPQGAAVQRDPRERHNGRLALIRRPPLEHSDDVPAILRPRPPLERMAPAVDLDLDLEISDGLDLPCLAHHFTPLNG